jgi:short-subunit dehydrogenase
VVAVSLHKKLLVNNAGFDTAGDFVDLPVSREEQQVQLNVVAVLR